MMPLPQLGGGRTHRTSHAWGQLMARLRSPLLFTRSSLWIPRPRRTEARMWFTTDIVLRKGVAFALIGPQEYDRQMGRLQKLEMWDFWPSQRG